MVVMQPVYDSCTECLLRDFQEDIVLLVHFIDVCTFLDFISK